VHSSGPHTSAPSTTPGRASSAFHGSPAPAPYQPKSAGPSLPAGGKGRGTGTGHELGKAKGKEKGKPKGKNKGKEKGKDESNWDPYDNNPDYPNYVGAAPKGHDKGKDNTLDEKGPGKGTPKGPGKGKDKQKNKGRGKHKSEPY